MNVFIWFMAAILALDCLVRLFWLGTGNYPQRTPGNIAGDLACNAALLIWACVLLGNSP
ncbi:hypothetical protein [Sphingomonas sp.]|jgi:hypothetical protein|uniref:hypothetical protein n=1 Tax=Sphingomonas sp. TaxID=28214 RepID=UPI00356457D6